MPKIMRAFLLVCLSLFFAFGIIVIANDFQIFSYRRFFFESIKLAPIILGVIFLLSRFALAPISALKNRPASQPLIILSVFSVLISLLLVPYSPDRVRYIITLLVVATMFFVLAVMILLLTINRNEKYISAIILVFLAVVGLIGYCLFLYMSQFVRMYGDDFCYRNFVLQSGYFPAVINFYLNWSGRLFSIFLSFAATGKYFGVGVQILLIGVAGFYSGYVYSSPFSNKLIRFTWGLAVATLIPCLVFVLIPDPYKTIYWTVASTDYLPLLILAPFYLLLMGFTFQGRFSNRWLYSALVFLVSFLLTNTHEVAALPVLFLNSLFFGVALITDRKNVGTLMIFGSAFAGSLVGSAITILSPGNSVRQVTQAYPQPPDLLSLLRMTTVYTSQYFLEIMNGQKWLALVSAFLLGYLGPKTLPGGKFSPLIAFAIVSSMAWLCFVPGVYIAQAQIPPRAQFIPTLFLVMGFFCAGNLTRFESGGSVVLAMASVYLVVSVFFFHDLFGKKIELVQPFRQYAQDWDARDQLLRMADTIPDKIDIPWDSTEQEFNCAIEYYHRSK